MAVPTITSITPSTGLTMAGEVVSIVGTDFAVPVLPPTSELSDGAPLVTVRVLFDGEEGTEAAALSDTLVTVRPPKHAAGAVDVVLQNIDQETGEVISGEEVTLEGGFTYVLPTHTAEYEGDLARLVRALLRLMKRELIAKDVTHAVHTDYVDPDNRDTELHIAKFAELPGISLIGPDLEENRFYSLNEEPTILDPEEDLDEDDNPTAFVQTKVPYTVDVRFDLIGASNSKIELLNLMQNFTLFMHGNKYIVLDKSGDDASLGTVRYEMDFMPGGQPKARKVNVGPESASNVRVFDATIVIRGFDLDATSGIAAGKSAGVPNQAVIRRGKTLDELRLDPALQTAVSSPRPGDPSPG